MKNTKYIVFRSFEGPTLTAKVKESGGVLELIDYVDEYVNYKGELNKDSELDLEQCGVFAKHITEITKEEYMFLTGNAEIERQAQKEEGTAKMEAEKIRETKSKPSRVKLINKEEYVSVEPWGEDLVEEKTWLMSDGSLKKDKKVKGSH